MVSDRVYRKGRSPDEACAELRRCAGMQFDPELVERFIGLMLDRQSGNTGVVPQLSKEAALSIGLQLERLATAVDHLDLEGLKALAGRLQETAAKERAAEIACKALELELAVDAGADAMQILSIAGQLMQACRSTQVSYLRDSDGGKEQTRQVATEREAIGV